MQIIISPTYSQHQRVKELADTAHANGISTNSLMNGWRSSDNIYSKADFAFYGETSFCEFLAQEFQYKLHSNALDWAAKLPIHISKRSIRFMTLKEANEEKENIIGSRWVEPADDRTAFQAGIPFNSMPTAHKDTPIIVSSDINWQCKYRFVIIHGKIETSCCYRLANIIDDPKIHKSNFINAESRIDAPTYVNILLSKFETSPACIIDVGHHPSIGWGIIGTYPVWSSEMYGCDPGKFIKALFVSCERVNKIL